MVWAMEIKYDSAQKRLQLTENKTTDQWGTVGLTCLHYLFTSNSQCHLAGPFLTEMPGQQNWFEWQGNKIGSKRPVGGH